MSLVFQPESIAARFGKLPPEFLKSFIADRSALFTGGLATRVPLEVAKHQWPTLMARLQQQLERESGDFLFGEASLADIAMAHPLWFLRGTPVTAPLVDAYPAVATWLARVLDFGHGSFSDMTAEEAVGIAREATPAALPDDALADPNGFAIGQQVAISAVDYGVDAVEGELVFSGTEALILRREDPRAGTVHVHFPRIGFAIKAL